MKPSAVWLDDNPTYKGFVMLFARCVSWRGVEYKGRTENIKPPGKTERKIQFDSDKFRSINEVYSQLTHYIDLYRSAN